MAVDLTIQLFAYELFNHLWAKNGRLGRSFSASTILSSLKVESHLTTEIVDAVICRQVMFREIYCFQFKSTKIALCNNPSDFLAHLCIAFSDDTFADLKVFDRILATCAFVMEMSLHCCVQGNEFFSKDDFLCLAMYFDTELKKEFYEQGGWKVLKSVAKSYVLPLLALTTLSDTPSFIHVHLGKFATGMDDYYYFQKFEDQGSQTCAKSWVNFRLRNGKNSGSNSFHYNSVEKLEEFLTCFKFLCDPLGERVLEGDIRSPNENLIAKFKGNEYLENLAMKVSDGHSDYPTKPSDCSQDLEISPHPEVFQGQKDTEEALTMQFQGLEISRLANDKSIDNALTTQKATVETSNLLKDSPVNETNNFLKNEVLEDEDEKLQTPDITTDPCLDDNIVIDQDPRLHTEDGGKDNLLKNCTTVDQDNKENTNPCLRRLNVYDSIVDKLGEQGIHELLSHVTVFISDHRITYTEDLVPNKSCLLKNSNASVKSTSQVTKATTLEGHETQKTTKNKKKKRKTKSGKATDNATKAESGKATDNATKSDFDSEDTKDILRMVLVLGCKPGVNYIRSTLKQSYMTTSV